MLKAKNNKAMRVQGTSGLIPFAVIVIGSSITAISNCAP